MEDLSMSTQYFASPSHYKHFHKLITSLLQQLLVNSKYQACKRVSFQRKRGHKNISILLNMVEVESMWARAGVTMQACMQAGRQAGNLRGTYCICMRRAQSAASDRRKDRDRGRERDG